MVKGFLKQSWLVMVSSLVFGLLVASVHGVLKDRIAANAAAKLQREMSKLLVGAESFEARTDDKGATVFMVASDLEGAVVGYAIQAEGAGFADKIRLLVALGAKAETLLGVAVLRSSETPGFGDKINEEEFADQFEGIAGAARLTVIKTGDRSIKDEEIVAITGATISSDAVVKIANKAMNELRDRINSYKK